MQSAHDSLGGLDLNLLLALDALLAERHVTRAAARLGLTQSAASHALARLRTALGDPLLVRGGRGAMVPTPRAEALAGPLGQALAALAAAVHGPPAFEPATARRTFRVASGDYGELVLLPPLAARLATAAPGIDLWFHQAPNDLGAALAAGTIDVVFAPVRGRAWPAGCFEKKLFRETFTCVVRKRHPIAGQRLTLARYCALSHLLVAPRGTPGSIVDDALAAGDRARRIAVAVPHFLVVPHVVAATDLVATLATRVVDAIAPLHELVRLPPPVELPGFDMAMVWHERAHHDPPQRWLREQVAAVAAELA
jgi:DNA-binding transcriptional LysR family regulator